MKRFKEARLNKKIKISDAAELLGVTPPTICSWESERKSPTIDMLLKIAELYGVTPDYLLGIDAPTALSPDKEIPIEIISIYDAKPVWVQNYGWALVNAADNTLVFSNGERIDFSDAPKSVLIPYRFCETELPNRDPIPYQKLLSCTTVWLEPISKDLELRNALRGRYEIKNGFAENDKGNRFTLSSYGASWLAFEIVE